MSKIFNHRESFELECGKRLSSFHLSYTTIGTMNEEKNNVIWIFHALTANDNPLEWWHGLVGEHCLFTPKDYFIVCVNTPGSCYGSIGPLDINEETGKPFYHTFPWFTPRDMIKAYQLLKKELGIEKIFIGLGGSMGGQQLLEWAIDEPDLFEHIIPIATNARHSAWGIAFNASQRMCIEYDPTWKEEHPEAGLQGMKTARSIALISYRNHDTYDNLQQGIAATTEHLPLDEQIFRAETYQKYQGEKLARRFNAFSYFALSKGMDSHNVGRGRGSVEAALQSIKAKALVIGISTDLLFPPQEQAFIAQHIPEGKFIVIESLYGHDGFLLEFAQIDTAIRKFLKEVDE